MLTFLFSNNSLSLSLAFSQSAIMSHKNPTLLRLVTNLLQEQLNKGNNELLNILMAQKKIKQDHTAHVYPVLSAVQPSSPCASSEPSSCNSTPSLSRSWSGSSTTSIPSSQGSHDGYDDSHIPLGRQGFCPGDRAVVTRPVMRALDALYLAPKISPLFARRFRVKRDAQGTQRLRKNAEMDETAFHKLVDPAIRRLVRNSASTDPRLRDRYYNAALAVVKKRRANHAQWWRLYKTHKELIYGGQELYDAKFADKWKEKSVVKKVKVERHNDKSAKTPQKKNTPKRQIRGDMTPPTTTKKERPSAPRK